MLESARDLLRFIDASPTPYHAVEEVARRLDAAGYVRIVEQDPWDIQPGTQAYVIRNEGSIIAFHVGEEPIVEAGCNVIGAHTDSPNLRIRPNPDGVRGGCSVLGIEPYGGVLLHTWLDRDLSLAGRVTVRTDEGARFEALVDLEKPLFRVPNLAIHLQREIRSDGLKLNPQRHLRPLVGLQSAPTLESMVLDAIVESYEELPVRPSQILAHDLMLYDTQPSSLAGVDDVFINAPRLDNLGSCHAALSALLAGSDAPAPFTRIVALWDHEEVGSRTADGAAGSFLRDVFSRLTGGREDLRRCMAMSTLVSCDMAHAVHPNYEDRHDPAHMPRLGAGPVIKWNQGQSYASDSGTGGYFASLCTDAGVSYQHFVSRNDMGCGSTIGPIASASLGIRTVDVGNPMLSMHSCREMAGSGDVAPMIRVLSHYLGVSDRAVS